jgi:hypothetical protein
VVLMQPSLPATQALPVLRASFAPQPMQTARISGVQYAVHQSAALPGDPVTVTGVNLFGATRVSITNQRYGVQLLPVVTQALGDSVAFTMPTELMQPFPAGVYELAVQFMDGTGTIVQQTSNSIPFAVSPTLPTQTATTAPLPPTSLIAVTVSGISPQVYEGQSVTLALSTTSAPVVSKSAQAQPFTGKVSSLTFQFDAGLPAAVQLLGRLQVDGVTSQVQVAWTPFPPTFSGPWVTL